MIQFSILGLVIAYIVLLWPKHVLIDQPAVIYRLGDENKNTLYETYVTLEGNISKSLFLKKTFKGSMSITDLHDLDLTYRYRLEEDALNNGEFELNMDNVVKFLHCVYLDDGRIDMISIGQIEFDKQYDNLTIALHTNDGSGSAWNSNDGWMLTTAKSRLEAIKFSSNILDYDLYD